jgi:hypothetical protein
MTVSEAEKILKAWQSFMEVWDKFNILMLDIPPSFYPYPPEKLEEGLNIMENLFATSGNNKMANAIQITKVNLWNLPKDDEEALKNNLSILNMMFENNDLKTTLLNKLHETRDRWINLRNEEKNIKI